MIRENSEPGVKPAITISEADYDRLSDLAAAARGRSPEVADELLFELDRASVVEAGAVPSGVVRMGSTVEFASDGGKRTTVTLVYPGEADVALGRISIMTPVGAALIGLSVGQSIAWAARDGSRHDLTVLRVEQSAAARTG